ncbi:MAG: hypothetical protein JWL94_1715 [Microbacteriaceae bacterium]|nr:hypothetical protein [Microbacteriaceae bacterium]HEV7957037.1 YggS family pyridoxal phosphate-dependent enzyme [Marisediminicola sp.]
MTETLQLRERLNSVRAGINAAAAAAGRDSSSITLVVVTKFHPAPLVRELHDLGVRDFGENRHQEAQAKSTALSDLDLTWHFVGQLQSKKARQAAAYARVIHSLDRNSVIDALSSDERHTDVFVQVNLAEGTGRGGVAEADVETIADRILSTPGLNLLGVMAVAPLGETPRRAFARLRAASERVIRIAPKARFISAGMSGDYPEAILEGATHLRIGSAITGNRQPDG